MEDFFKNVGIPKLSEYQIKLCEEAVVRRCSVKKDTLAQVFSCEFCEICNNTFSYRTPLVDASACEEDLTEKN